MTSTQNFFKNHKKKNEILNDIANKIYYPSVFYYQILFHPLPQGKGPH